MQQNIIRDNSMKNAHIHPTAIIEEGAIIGESVTIEPYAIVKSNVTLHDNVIIKSHAYIDGFTEIGKGTTVYPGASIGTKTQDRKFRGEKTFVKIGENCDIREFVTINSSCGENSAVEIGSGCLIMAYCHVAHNCILGNNVILSNGAQLAGHIIVEDNAIVGGMTPIHQNVRIGRHAMVGGLSRVTHDIPPYLLGAGIPFKFGGVNLVGLKRYNFPLKTQQLLAEAFKILYRSGMRFTDAIECIEQTIEPIPEIVHFTTFCRETKRGLLNDQTRSTEESLEPAPIGASGA